MRETRFTDEQTAPCGTTAWVWGPPEPSIIDNTPAVMSSQSGLGNHLQAGLDFHGTGLFSEGFSGFQLVFRA